MTVIMKFLITTCLLLFAYTVSAMEVAITVDDLPANGNLSAGTTRMDIAKKILSVLNKHHIKNVYGFVNGAKVNEVPNGYVILSDWRNEGQLLGNHTFHHLDLAKISAEEYKSDIKKNEPILSQFMRGDDYRYFRYPYLTEGNTQHKRDNVRNYLFSNGYKIAPVTVDFFEYEWNDAYVRCLNRHDEKSIKWIKNAYLEQANNALTIAKSLSSMLFGRDIKHVLLIHMNEFSADMLDEMLTEYEKKHVKFIALSAALKDKAYTINPNIIHDRDYTFLNQVRLSRGLKNPDNVKMLYDSLPEDKLNQLCN